MKKSVSGIFLLIFGVFFLYAQDANNVKTYRIGEMGPAGGLIFYDKGSFSNGWQYLEAAPPDHQFKAFWGIPKNRETGTAIGTGRENTQQNDSPGTITFRCTQLNINGFYDWFVPSKDELNMMYKNLKLNGLGGFHNNFYWSSSIRKIDGWYQHFGSGNQNVNPLNLRGSDLLVRPIRAF